MLRTAKALPGHSVYTVVIFADIHVTKCITTYISLCTLYVLFAVLLLAVLPTEKTKCITALYNYLYKYKIHVEHIYRGKTVDKCITGKYK